MNFSITKDENALPLKLRKLIEELLLNPEGLVKPNESVAPPSFTCKEHFYEIWDLPGAFMYFMLNQTLLSANAIYIFVMDVSKEIEPDTSTVEAKSNDASKSKPDTGDSSTATESSATSDVLNEFHVWLGALHVQLSDVCSFDPQQPLQPKVILVASHRNSLHKQPLARDAALRELFEKVRQSVSGRPYESLLSPNYFALDLKKMSFDEPQRLTELRTAIDQTSLEQRLLSSYVPISWLRLQRCLERLAGRGVHFVARSQLLQLLSSQFEPQQMLLNSTCSLHTALAFMQSNGKLLGFGPEVGSGLVSDTSGPLWSQGNDCACYACSNCAQYGSNCPATTAAHFNGTNGSHSTYSNTRNRSLNGFDCTCENNYYHKCSDQVANPCLDSTDWMLVLQPHWLLGCCYRLCAFVLRLRSEHRDALVSGVLREQLLDRCWADRFEQKHVLVGCLERLDLLCELRPYIGSDETPEITSSRFSKDQVRLFTFVETLFFLCL